MRIYTTFKPIRVESDTKRGIVDKVVGRRGLVASWSGWCVGAYSTPGFGRDNEYVVGINYEKRRHRKTSTGEKVRETHWVGFYYVFSRDFLKATGLRVVQNSRNFRLEKAKK